MRRLMPLTRRRFGALAGAGLTLPPRLAWASGQAHRMDIARFRFDQPELRIRVGDTVIWTNRDTAPHTATATDGRWDTGQLDKGMAGAVTFDTTGRFSYVCAFHPHMKAVLIVEPDR